VQPPCQQKMPGFIGFYGVMAQVAEKIAERMRTHPAI
jgi:hypothetical protein